MHSTNTFLFIWSAARWWGSIIAVMRWVKVSSCHGWA